MSKLLNRPSLLCAVAAVGGGVLWALCFGREGFWVLPWFALLPLIGLIGQERDWAWAWLHGWVFWMVGIGWLIPTLESFGNLPWLLSVLLMALLAIYLGAYHAVFIRLGRVLWLRGGLWALLGLPSLWVVLEWLRSWRGWMFKGFPWNLAGYAWVDIPGVLPLAAWVGVYGISFLVLFIQVGLVLAWQKRRLDLAVLMLLLPLNLLPVAGRWSQPEPSEFSSYGHLVKVLQPNLPIVRDDQSIRRNYNRLMAMSKAECRQPSSMRSLLVWPESAAWPFAYDRSPRLQHDLESLTTSGCDVILNSPTWEGETLFNSALLISEEGAKASYQKRHLVPYGEYVPLANLFPFIGKLAREAGSFAPGSSTSLMPWQGERIGMAICYEITYPEAIAAQVRDGATLLATITNDAWYGDSAAPWQHFRAARFRAAENRRPLLRAALTGVSGLIDARGFVEAELGVGESGVLSTRIAGYRGASFYSRFPWLVPVLSFFCAAFAIVLSLFKPPIRALGKGDGSWTSRP